MKWKSYYFILGDISIDVSFKTSNNSTDYLNMLNSNLAVSLITTPTTVTEYEYTAIILVHILTNENYFSFLRFVIAHLIAHHFLVLVSSVSCKLFLLFILN